MGRVLDEWLAFPLPSGQNIYAAWLPSAATEVVPARIAILNAEYDFGNMPDGIFTNTKSIFIVSLVASYLAKSIR